VVTGAAPAAMVARTVRGVARPLRRAQAAWTARNTQNKKGKGVLHLAMVLRMKKTMTGRQRRGRSMTSGGRRRTASATARFCEEGEALGHRVLVQTAHATKEDEEARGSASPATRLPGGRQWRGGEILWAAARTRRWRWMRGSVEEKGCSRDSAATFKG
jgi:hypothetical protein